MIEAVVHSGTELCAGREPFDEGGLLPEVSCAIRYSIDEVVEIAGERRGIARDRLPRHVEIVVAIVVTLRVRRMRTPRFDDYRVHNRRGNDCAIGIGANDAFVDELLDHDDHSL